MKLALVGMGMGDAATLTVGAARLLEEAQVILGAPRLLENLPRRENTRYLPLALPREVAEQLEQNPHWDRVCVALSGDVGFYSGAAQLVQLLADLDPQPELKLVPGISSPQQLAARLGRPWQEFHLVSAHGKDCDILAQALNHPAVFCLTGGTATPDALCRQLTQAGLGDAAVTVGEQLGHPREQITTGTAEEIGKRVFHPLSVLLIENRRTFTRAVVGQGIPDGEFFRGGAPMTKREVRAGILARLGIRPGDILYDVGAGTGSVAVEMALLARWGRVYAIEYREEACRLIGANKEKFGVYNLTVIPGTAPEALEPLPAPNAAFVGGSMGSLSEILTCLHRKSPEMRIVVSAVTLDTLYQSIEALEALWDSPAEVVQIAVTPVVAAGRVRMFQAQNPIFLIAGGGRHDC